MTYAVIASSGTQYVVSEGDRLEISTLGLSDGDRVTFDRVLLLGGQDHFKLGTPLVEGAKVTGKIVKNFKGDKVDVVKFKSKSKYRRKMGFRATLCLVSIDKIDSGKPVASKA